VGLSERVRTRVEEFGRVELQDTEAEALVRSKAVHVVLLVVAVPTIVWSGNARVAVLILFLAFWLGGAWRRWSPRRAPGRPRRSRASAALLGVVGFFYYVCCVWAIERSGCGRGASVHVQVCTMQSVRKGVCSNIVRRKRLFVALLGSVGYSF
jgi:hypothetical protein